MSCNPEIKKTRFYKYATDVISGKVVACKYVRQSCERFLRDLEDERFVFRLDLVAHCVRFIRTLTHFSGLAANRSFVLESWELFIVANLIGFYKKDSHVEKQIEAIDRRLNEMRSKIEAEGRKPTTDELLEMETRQKEREQLNLTLWGKRRFNEAYVSIARKNGKTALFAALMIYFLLADGEPNAEVLIAANSRDQATDVDFKIVKGFILKLDPTEKTVVAQRNKVRVKKSTNTMYVVASDSSKLDGFNISACIVDEYHEADTDYVKEVLKTAMGNRKNPLQCVVTTRGFDKSKPCYQLDQYAASVLAGEKTDDAFFTIIFTIDEGDDWKDSANWIKANPNLDVTVNYDFLMGELTKALESPSKEVQFRTKYINEWVDSKTVWISDERIAASMRQLTFEQFRGSPCYAGLDLASVSDLAAVAYLWHVEGIFYFYVDCYLPSDALKTKENSAKYREFDMQGALNVFPDSNVLDYDHILDDIKAHNEVCPIYLISYDQWNSTQLVINATNAGFNCQPFSQSLSSFNRPTKEFERSMLNGKVVININPCVRWAFRNVLIKTDAHENQQIIKATAMSKIDPAVSMMMALGGYLTNYMPEFSGI